MNIKKIVYTGTLVALLASGIVSNTSRYAEAGEMYALAVRDVPAREVHKISNEYILSTTELEHIIETQYDSLRNSNSQYRMTPEKEAVISMDYSLNKVFIESGNKINADSYVGASGLWQVMPNTWKHVEKKYDFAIYKYDPQINTRVGLKYLIDLYDFLEQNHPRWDMLNINEKQELISAAYNGGPNRLTNREFDITRMPEETRNYVEKMKGRYPILQNRNQVENYLATNTDIKQFYNIANPELEKAMLDSMLSNEKY